MAQAAILSVGRDFAQTVERAADEAGLSVGAYGVRKVQAYVGAADRWRLRRLEQRMAGDDMPVLRGLRHILECEMRRERVGWDDDRARPNPMSF